MQIIREDTGKDVTGEFMLIETIVLEPNPPDKNCKTCNGKGYTKHSFGNLRCACAWH